MSRVMRLLSALMALSLAPLFMGDTLQVFCLSHWKLSNAQVSQLFTGVAIQGVIANTISVALIKRLGIPQGQLSGDRANLVAWLKVLGPLVYGNLYVLGVRAHVPAAPFWLNAALAVA